MIAAPQSATRQCRGGQIEHRRTTMKRHGRLVAGFVLLALAVGLVAPAPAQEKPWWPFPVEDRDPPFNMEGKKVKKDYVPIDHADRKSTRLNSSHGYISYAVFCLKKKKKKNKERQMKEADVQ